MAGYLPELALLSPKTMYSPYRDGERKSISAPNTAKATSFSPNTLKRSNTEVPKSSVFHMQPPNQFPTLKTSKLPSSIARATPPPTQNPTTMPSCLPAIHPSSPQSLATSSPSPALDRTGSIRQRASLRFFKHGGGSTEPTDTKPKRKKLVKKGSISQPTFVMVNPSAARAERAAMEAGAAQLGLQLEEAVAEMESSAGAGSDEALDYDGTPAAVRSTDADDRIEVDDEDHQQIKRWSRAPLLPEFDFSSTSSDSNHRFDPVANELTTQDATPPKDPAEVTSAVSDLRQAYSSARTATVLTSKDPSELTYRCNIHARTSALHLAVERACFELITEAGGCILDSYSCPGGFLFRLPPEIPEPIASCELPTRGVKIELERWTEFSLPKFDGLRMHPPSVRYTGERQVIHGEATPSEATESLGGKSKTERRVQTRNHGLLACQKTSGGHNIVKESPKSSKVATEELKRCLPKSRQNILSLVGSLETIRRFGHEESGTTENASLTPKSVKDLRSDSEHRFTVVSDASDSDDESGAEEWESVRSELEG